MRAIQRYLPRPRHVELHRITVAAPPDAAWQAVRHFDGATIPWVRLVFDLRELPGRLLGQRLAEDRRLGVDQVVDRGRDFILLEERVGEEVVVGAIGQFWHLQIPYADVAIDDFADFDAPGWGKVGWALRVEPWGTGSVVTFELRTDATDDESWHRQERYFRVIGPVSHLIRGSVMTHLEAQLGRLPRSADADVRRDGDPLLPDARYALDHGIDVEAPPALVWPWLMQLGCDRGGWYSIDALDHDHQPSVDRLLPEWRERAVGDRLAVTPQQDSFFTVRKVAPERSFVIGGEADRLGGHVELTWEWSLEPLGGDATHLATRIRARGAPRWSEWLQGAVVFPPLHAVMQRAQLHNLARLAEREAQARRG
jgi:hypothetical protein